MPDIYGQLTDLEMYSCLENATLDEDGVCFTDWEIDFLNSIDKKVTKEKLSAKQSACLLKIYEKYCHGTK